MQHLDVRHKRTTPWPWLAGAVVLALIVWGVTGLLAAPDGEDEPMAVITAEDTLPPAAIPAPAAPVQTQRVRGLHDFAPLGEDDVGERVRADGEVVATGTTGFWMAVGNEVVRIDSERLVRKGETLAVQGILQRLEDGDRTERIASEVLSRDPRADGWQVVRTVKLVEDGVRVD